MPTVHLRYFASLREQADRNAESRDTCAATLGELYDELREAYGFTLAAGSIRAAVAERYVPLDTPVTDDMEVTFIPPVAGG